MRELLGKNELRSEPEKASTEAPIEFAENPHLPETSSTTSRAETQSRSTSIGGILIVVTGREHVNENGEQGRVEKMGQNLEEYNVEFPMIERQL